MDKLTYATVCSGIECVSAAVADLPLEPIFFSEIEPFPCAVLKSHFPEVPNFGDMSKIVIDHENEVITNGKISIPLPKNRLDLLVGGTPCFTAGTMVLTPKGYVPIETLKIGSSVITGNGNVRSVKDVGNKMAKVGVFTVKGRPEIVCTPNHPFMCAKKPRKTTITKSSKRKCTTTVDAYAETRADEAKGRYVGKLNPQPYCMVDEMPKCYNLDESKIIELAGCYVAAGTVVEAKNSNLKTLILELDQHKFEKFSKSFNQNTYIAGKDNSIHIRCTELAEWLVSNFGEGKSKTIPYWVYKHKYVNRFISGFTICIDKAPGKSRNRSRSESSFMISSPAIAYGIADILNTATISIDSNGNYIINSNDKSTVEVIERRYAVLAESYEPATKSRGREPVQRVYNITVDEEHTYIANGLYTHNCQDVSKAGARRGMAEDSGTRSSLAFDFARLIRELKPNYFIWENVPGVLSDESFPKFIQRLGELGYSIAYRTLDSKSTSCPGIQFEDGRYVQLDKGVPQSRRRVWAIGCFGANVTKAASVLFEDDRNNWYDAAHESKESEANRDTSKCPVLHAEVLGEVSKPEEPGGESNQELRSGIGPRNILINGEKATEISCYDNHIQDCRCNKVDICPTLTASHGTGGNKLHFLVYDSYSTYLGAGSHNIPFLHNKSVTLTTRPTSGVVCVNKYVNENCDNLKSISSKDIGEDELQDIINNMKYIARFFTPTELERLMGLPDGWTIPSNLKITDELIDEFVEIFKEYQDIMGYYNMNTKKPKSKAQVKAWLNKIVDPDSCPKGARIKSLGNGMVTNQIRWIVIRLLQSLGVNGRKNEV